jgi:stage II sporulation protein D
MKAKLIFPFVLFLVMLFVPIAAFGRLKPESDIAAGNPSVSAASDSVLTQTHEGSATSASSGPASQIIEPGTMSYKSLDIDGFKILNETTGSIDRISVADYVIGAVMSEMPATFDKEALKAQAVAAHTYALRSHESQIQNPDPSLRGADFRADPPKYLGYMTMDIAKDRFGVYFDEYYKKISEAAHEVMDEILVYEGEPIVAAYHAISAGKTEAASNVWISSVSYLVPVDSEGDLLSSGYEVTTPVSADDVKSKILGTFPDIKFPDNPSDWFEILSRSDSGYITEMKVGDTDLTGLEVRNALGLRSSDFEIQQSGETFSFTTFGYGHGVGLSQYGSDYMARQGFSYSEILTHYYQGTEIVNIKK